MPTTALGQQLITFAIETDEDQSLDSWVWYYVKAGDTVAKIAAARGHRERARDIADRNDIRSVYSALHRSRIQVPGTLKDSASFSVMAGDGPPTIVDGYAKFGVIDRPQMTGISDFQGYDPIQMSVPVRFEAGFVGATTRITHSSAYPGLALWRRSNIGDDITVDTTTALNRQGADIEDDISLLERMAGRGNFPGASVGAPPVLRLSTTNSNGDPVPLIPKNYQWVANNPSPPLWQITAIEWADDVPAGVLRNDAGNRIRQKATILVQQRSRAGSVEPSAAKRSEQRRAQKKQ